MIYRLAKAAALLILLCACLVWLAPATWLDHLLRRYSDGSLGLGNPQGRLWAGSGTLQAVLPQGAVVTLAPLRWNLGFVLPAGARLTLVSTRDGRSLLDISAETGGFILHAARLELPAALLGRASPTLGDAELGGQLTLKAQGLGHRDGRFSGQGEIAWDQAASALAGNTILGNYRIQLQGAGESLNAQISTPTPAALTLSGRAQWRLGQVPSLDVTATPAEAERRALEPLLRLLGRQIRPGVYQLILDGNLGAARI